METVGNGVDGGCVGHSVAVGSGVGVAEGNVVGVAVGSGVTVAAVSYTHLGMGKSRLPLTTAKSG